MDTKLFLAPMDGITDFIMRDVLTKIGGIDYCVSEFLRVTNSIYPDRIFFEHCPELKNNSLTNSGIPTFLQLLGNHPELLAANALRATQLGAKGIDLNFGCPAKTVNNHKGGAILLREPRVIFDIVKTVRAALPLEIPVSAKIRLGYEDPNQCFENVKAIEEAGASWLTIHCRTKTDGYKPPAYWEWIPKIRETTQLQIVANGEINSLEDFNRCKIITGCSQFMIGRASIADPFIFLKIKNEIESKSHGSNWQDLRLMLPPFYKTCEQSLTPAFAVARTKQWLKYLAKANPEALDLFEAIKTITQPTEFESQLEVPTS